MQDEENKFLLFEVILKWNFDPQLTKRGLSQSFMNQPSPLLEPVPIIGPEDLGGRIPHGYFNTAFLNTDNIAKNIFRKVNRL